jgi:hypothetical protein
LLLENPKTVPDIQIFVLLIERGSEQRLAKRQKLKKIRTSKNQSERHNSKGSDNQKGDHNVKNKTDQNVESDLPMAFGLLNLT